ncbi:condensation domain-containing protein [Pseudomonas frederiksbergensis]|uniref:TubC N-terminal docking domain-related protein n=1 Tax=Pseudomonas frederiksbergensis TaxID=104087 RepID=UPI003D1BA3C4
MNPTLSELVSMLGQRGIELWVDGGRLRCKAPKGVLDKETQQLLSKHKEELVSVLSRFRPVLGNTTIASRSTEGELPLSFAQERLWFLEKYDPLSGAYHIAGRLRLTGDLHIDAVEKSLRRIIERHQILRTNFFDRDGVPYAEWALLNASFCSACSSTGRATQEGIAPCRRS